MTARAATRCWGLVLALGGVVPLACRAKSPVAPAPPALPTYEFAWRADLGSSGSIHLTVGASMVFVAGGDDALAAFGAADGRRIWSAKDVGSGATLTAAGGLLYVLTPGHVDDGNRRIAGRLDVFGQADGHLAWKIDALPEPMAGPVVTGRTLILAAGAEVRGFSAYDGFVSWRTPLDAPPVALAADGTRVFVALDNRALLGLDPDTHATAWQTQLESRATCLVAADNRVIACEEDGALSAYRQDRRAPPIWRVPRVEAVGPPALDGARVYVGQFDNTARAYDAGNGTERWRLRLGSRPRPGVQVAGAQMFMPLLTGVMGTCLARPGLPFGQIPLLAPAGAPPAADERLEASGVSSDGALIFRVTRPSSHTIWTLTAVRKK